MAKYYSAVNFGVGFITHSDREAFDIRGEADDLWVIEAPNDASYGWAARVGAVEVPEAEALARIAEARASNDPIPA